MLLMNGLKNLKTNNMTAVEWLEKELTEVERNLINKTFLQLNNSLAGHRLKDIFEQAKEMEKEQIIKAHGIKTKSINQDQSEIITGRQYYNEKFNK